MGIVLGFVLVALVGGFLAWLVQGRRGAAQELLAPPSVPESPAPVADTRGFLDSHFGEDEEPAVMAVPRATPEPSARRGSARPLEGGASPGPSYVIKGNASSKIFHTPESVSFERTIAEIWFETEADAVAAGYRAPKKRAPRTTT